MATGHGHPLFKSGEILILDGGTSNELMNHIDFDIHKDPLWTAKALLNAPEAVVKTHLAYLEGADIISTITYQASIAGFSKHLSLSTEEGEALVIKAVTLAKDAVNEFSKSDSFLTSRAPLIAGSVGPYGAYLSDRSEYTGAYMDDIHEEELTTFHFSRLRSLIEAGVDLLLIETMPSVKEVEIILKTLERLPPVKSLVSFTLAQHQEDVKLRTAYGDDIKSILELVRDYPDVIGFGCNCCSPESVRTFLKETSSEAETLPDFDLGLYKRIVYPNKGNWYSDAGWVEKDNDIPSAPVDSYVKQWMFSGAEILGGCCEVGPSVIAKIRTEVVLEKHTRSLSG